MSKLEFCLDQLSALELDPVSFVEVAAKAGFNAVGLHLVGLPLDGAARYDMITDAALFRQVQRRLRDAAIRLHILEPFLVSPDVPREALLKNLDLGGDLGTKVVGVLSFDPDVQRRSDGMAQLAQDAEARGLALSIEPYFASSYPSFSAAVAAAAQAGHGAGVTLDILHLVRGGEHWEAVRSAGPALLRTIQVSDGPLSAPADRAHEATRERGLPGEGEFRPEHIVQYVPQDVPIGIEVPSMTLSQMMPALERVRFLKDKVETLLSA